MMTKPMKSLRCYAAIHMPFEAVMVFLGSITTWYGGIFPILPLVGSSVVTCCAKCCCTSNGGKGIVVTYIALNSVAFLGSIWDYFALSSVKKHCDDISEWSTIDEYCNYVDATTAFAIICFIFRVMGIILASCVACCRPAELETITEPPLAVVMENK